MKVFYKSSVVTSATLGVWKDVPIARVCIVYTSVIWYLLGTYPDSVLPVVLASGSPKTSDESLRLSCS